LEAKLEAVEQRLYSTRGVADIYLERWHKLLRK